LDALATLVASNKYQLPHVAVGARRRERSRRAIEDRKMDMSKYAGSGFLNVEKMKRRGTMTARIEAVNIGKYDKPNITIDTGEVLSANATVVSELIGLFGSESDDWVGCDIELYIGTVAFQGVPKEAILVRAVADAPAPTPTPTAKQTNNGGDTAAAERRASVPKSERKGGKADIDDEIPF
jgi:hypothetical protein